MPIKEKWVAPYAHSWNNLLWNTQVSKQNKEKREECWKKGKVSNDSENGLLKRQVPNLGHVLKLTIILNLISFSFFDLQLFETENQ